MNQDDYLYVRPTRPSPNYAEYEPVDWRTVGSVANWLIGVIGWALWLFFLVIPTINSSHGAGLYPIENNIVFVLTGLVLAIASSTAWKMAHPIRSAAFTLVILVLAFWF